MIVIGNSKEVNIRTGISLSHDINRGPIPIVGASNTYMGVLTHCNQKSGEPTRSPARRWDHNTRTDLHIDWQQPLAQRKDCAETIGALAHQHHHGATRAVAA